MSSGSPSQIVHEVGGPARSAEEDIDRLTEDLALQIVQGGIDRGSRRVFSWALRQPPFDRFEGERIIAEEIGRLIEEGGGRGDALAVVILREASPWPTMPSSSTSTNTASTSSSVEREMVNGSRAPGSPDGGSASRRIH